MNKIILASASSRRSDILKMCGFNFSVIPSNADETITDNLTPSEIVLELSKRKALSVRSKLTTQDNIILAADTVVSLENMILGKPSSEHDAYRMLVNLSDKTHKVYTGVTIIYKEIVDSFFISTDVTFNKLSDSEIQSYIATKEPMDKAGAYGIQGNGAIFVKEIKGDYFNVVGLPISSVYQHLQAISCKIK